MKATLNKYLIISLVTLAASLLLTSVVWAGWSNSSYWQFNAEPLPTCGDGIRFGFAIEERDDIDYTSFTFTFYRGTGDNLGDEIGAFTLENLPTIDNSPQPYCSGFDEASDPGYCEGPFDVEWDPKPDDDDQIQLVITDGDDSELTNAGESEPHIVECVDLEINLVQTGPGTTASTVTDALVFQVEAYNPDEGTNDGDGIDHVDMRIFDPDGQEVRQKTENNVKYCVFGGGNPNCNVWNFADNGYQWPNGTPINNGTHTLQATAHTDSGASDTKEFPIQIELPIAGNWVQIGENATATTVTDALVGQVEAYLGAPIDGKDVDRVVITLIGPDGQTIRTKTESNDPYCLFGGGNPCPVHNFADNDYEWPNGQSIQHGTHTLTATIYADDPGNSDDRSETIEAFVFDIQMPPIMTHLAQTGPDTTASVVTDTLVFQLEAFIGGGNLDGTNIDNVDMQIIDPTGSQVHQRTESNPKYCIFGGGEPDCNQWVFADHDYKWPSGASIKHGQHTLRATVNTKDGRSETVEFVIDIQMPPIMTHLAQTGPGTTNPVVTDTLVFQLEAFIGDGNIDGTNIDNVDMRINGPDGNQVHQLTDDTAKYCAFGGGEPDCNEWVFAGHDYQWPGGAEMKNGDHILRATVNTKDGRSEMVEFTIQIDNPELVDPAAAIFLPLIVK